MVGQLIIPHLHVPYHRYTIILQLHSLLLMCKTILTPNRLGTLSPDPLFIPPFSDDFVCSPLQTVPKRGPLTRRVVMDLSFPHGFSVNDGIPQDSYLGENFKLRLRGIDWLVDFILEKGRHCLVFKKDLRRAYRQFPIDPKDHNVLGVSYQGKFYFDTCCSFGLRTSAMICQRMTKAVVHIFTKQGFLADVYLDDFYGA